jgi:hypothetical protein
MMPLYTSDEGASVDVSTDTLPGMLTRTGLAEARQKGLTPSHKGGFAFATGPEGAIVEGFERAGPERLGQIDMWQDYPVCAEYWYQKHLNGTVGGGRAGAARPDEADCRVARGPDPSWPSTARQGTIRVPGGRVAFGDVALFWYMAQGDRPLAGTRGQMLDHIALAVTNLDGWVAKLKRENVTFLREAYAFGGTRAVLIEGPSHEALELVEDK